MQQARLISLVPALAAALLAAVITSAPIDVLVSSFMPDDTFYYLQTARVFVRTGLSSFDGVNISNGYQPLWFLVAAAAARILEGGEPLVRLMLGIATGLTLATFFAFSELVRRYLGAALALVACAIPLFFVRTMLNGLETPLYLCLFVLALAVWIQAWRECDGGRQAGPSNGLLTGTILGLAFLARTDFGLVVIPMLMALIHRRWRLTRSFGSAIAWLVPIALPAAAIAGIYLLTNLVYFGHLMPVSGAAKQFYSSQSWAAAMQQGRVMAWLGNAAWLLESGYRFILTSIVLPPLLVLLGRHVVLPDEQRQVIQATAVISFGLALVTLFYVTVFHGGFSRTFWYYGPHAFVCALAVAQAGQLASRILGGGALSAVLAAASLSSLALGWPPAAMGSMALAVPVGFALLAVVASWANRLFVLVLGLTGLAVAVTLFRQAGVPVVSLHGWAYGIAATAGGGLAVYAVSGVARRVAPLCVAVVMVVMTSAIHLANLRAEASTPPSGWNHSLLLGARWAAAHTPADATIWSGSAGILGYFSNRRVTNTDGLINSYDFLENVLKKGTIGEYIRQFDYAIDAYGDESLATGYPGGHFEPIGDLGQEPFSDGTFQRELRVFKMP